MTRLRTALNGLLERAFDYRHWLDARLHTTPVRELGLEYFWPPLSDEEAPSGSINRQRSNAPDHRPAR